MSNIQRKTIATENWTKDYIDNLLHKYGLSGVIFIDREDNKTKRELFIEDDTVSTQRKPELEEIDGDD